MIIEKENLPPPTYRIYLLQATTNNEIKINYDSNMQRDRTLEEQLDSEEGDGNKSRSKRRLEMVT